MNAHGGSEDLQISALVSLCRLCEHLGSAGAARIAEVQVLCVCAVLCCAVRACVSRSYLLRQILFCLWCVCVRASERVRVLI